MNMLARQTRKEQRRDLAWQQQAAQERNKFLLERRLQWAEIVAQEQALAPKGLQPGDARPFNTRLIGRAFSFRRLRRQVARKSPLVALNERLRAEHEAAIKAGRKPPKLRRLHATKGYRYGSCAA